MERCYIDDSEVSYSDLLKQVPDGVCGSGKFSINGEPFYVYCSFAWFLDLSKDSARDYMTSSRVERGRDLTIEYEWSILDDDTFRVFKIVQNFIYDVEREGFVEE